MKQLAPRAANASDIEVAITASDGLLPNAKYICTVQAYNAVGTSAPSSVIVCKEKMSAFN